MPHDLHWPAQVEHPGHFDDRHLRAVPGRLLGGIYSDKRSGRNGWCHGIQLDLEKKTDPGVHQQYRMGPQGVVLGSGGEFLTTVYDADLMQRMLTHWRSNSRLGTRMFILECVIQAHIEGKYALSVPVIIAQTEGLVAEVKGHKGRLKQWQYKAYIEESIAKDPQLANLV